MRIVELSLLSRTSMVGEALIAEPHNKAMDQTPRRAAPASLPALVIAGRYAERLHFAFQSIGPA